MQTKNPSPLSILSGRLMRKCLLVCLLIGVCAAQGAGQQAAENNDGHAFQRTQNVLDRLPDQIKAMDEPALRVFLRLRLAGFLWSKDFAESENKAETICVAALADLQAHQTEIPESDLKWLRREILSLLELHAPDRAARLIKQYGLDLNDAVQKVEAAYSSFDGKGNPSEAIRKVREVLDSGQNPGIIMLFFLDELKRQRPAEVPALLSSLLTIEEQKTGSIALQNLGFLIHLYLSKETPPALQERFLRAVVKATGGSFSGVEENQMSDAYNLLRAIVPALEQRWPALYSQASAQLAALAARLPNMGLELERQTLNKRIEQSADPLRQMITEAEETEDSAFRNDLLSDAAQLAVTKGELKLAVELVMRVESDWTHHLIWRDQFLSQAIDKALKKKETAIADYAIAQIHSPFNRAAALQRVALYFFAAGDSASALQRLNAAVKIIDSVESGTNRALALLGIIPSFARIDQQRLPELARAAVKAINSIRNPQPEDKPGSEAHKLYVETLIRLAGAAVPAFESLAERDEIGALSLADDLQPHEIRAAAVLGVANGLHKLEGMISKARPK